MSKTITALFPGRAEAAGAVDRLTAAGFGSADISVLMAQDAHAGVGAEAPVLDSPRTVVEVGARPVALEASPAPDDRSAPVAVREREPVGNLTGKDFGMEEHSKAPEGASAGAAMGGALGGILMGLAATGLILIPGVNLVAAGPVLAVLAGIGAGGTAGGVIGGLLGLGVPEHEAKLLDDGLRLGGILVGVYAHDDRVALARSILSETGGLHIH